MIFNAGNRAEGKGKGGVVVLDGGEGEGGARWKRSVGE